MAAPKGNKFWKLRSKHERDKLFSSSELLWEAACKYFEWCDNNPWIKVDWVGKDADKVERPTQRPFTISGLSLYLDASEAYWRNFKVNENISEDFLTVITRVEEIIRTQKFEGAVVGAFNANIISRDLGLMDKKGLNHTGNVQVTGMTII
jgi:hypothetical protein